MFRLGQRFGSPIVRQYFSSSRFVLPLTPLRLCNIITQQTISNHRLYATGGGKSSGDKTPCESAMQAKRSSGDCKPRARRAPCTPVPQDCQKIPSIDDCKKENLLDKCTKPDCPWDEGKGPGRNYRKLIWLGLILATAALGVMLFMGYKGPAKKKRKKKQVTKSRKRGAIEKIPTKSGPIPKNVPYLVIGGGTAAFAAFRSIKSTDPTAKILLISAEPYNPYMRPPLSKEMWNTEDKEMLLNMEFTQWNGKVRSLFYEPEDFYTNILTLQSNPNGGVAVARGWRVDKIDVIEKTAYLEDGAAIKYGKCLIATGAKPKTLEVFDIAEEAVFERVNVFRTISDFNCLRENLQDAKTVALIGGGFLGTEIACSIARFGKKSKLEVIQIFKEDGVLAKVLPEYLSMWASGRVQEEGVELIPQAIVMEAIADGDQVQLTLSNNTKLTVDEVLVCIGMDPNTQMAEESLLEVDLTNGGFLVNAELQARTDLWAAGDCASFYDVVYGRRRFEHHDNAVVTGRIAGENMCGASKPYLHQSMYWSDIGKHIGFEAIGTVDAQLPTVGVFVKPASAAGANTSGGADEDVARKQADGTNFEEEIPEQCEKYASKEIIEEQRKRLAKERELRSMEKENEDFAKGIVFYLKDDVVVGIVLWNVFHRMSIARQVLADKRKYEDLNEVAKLFKIHEE